MPVGPLGPIANAQIATAAMIAPENATSFQNAPGTKGIPSS